MAMYLARHPIQVPTYTIMLQGRWCSDAFLRYIRRQVQQFSSGVSAPARFRRLTSSPSPKHPMSSMIPGRLPNNRNSLASNVNGSARNTATPVRPGFALFH